VRIQSIATAPIIEIPFLNAGRGPGSFYEDRLSIHVAFADRLPNGADAVIATGDLQGRERFQESAGGPLRLLGEVLPHQLAADILPGLDLSPQRVGVLLAGDFYTVPSLDRRGGSGDVASVWQAFGQEFSWVVGVAGNHDTFGPDFSTPPRFSGHMHYLDNDRMNIGGMNIAGLGGIIGNPSRPRRRSEDNYVLALTQLLEHQTDVLLTHDGPDAPAQGFRGSAIVRETFERLRPSLVVRGHAHWPQPLVELSGGVQVLNVDARVVIIRRST
jgi:Icc-related predicted phosphoesterase